ncbi:MAG: crosslink repair DNA glycosylase YcaQ family protein, partial [Tepidiformaceae bacterium]
GDLATVEVEGWRGTHFMLASDTGLLEEVANGGIPSAWHPLGPTTTDEVALLSPLDPVSARGRAKALFDFDYVWEIYHRPDLVRFGRYTMPVLWGDQLVGRLDAKLDRKANTLVVNGVWLEEAATARDADFREALREGVRNMARFLGAARVDATAVTDRRLRTRWP